jgi:hypothetical protein
LGRDRADDEGGVKNFWLASYPKSGNTWMRILLANLLARDGAPVGINTIPRLGTRIAASRVVFEEVLLIDSGLLTQDEIDCLRPRLHEEVARRDALGHGAGDLPAVLFTKVHDAYTLTLKGEPLLAGARGADGAIVIVRDPRDVALSLAHQYDMPIDEAIAFTAMPRAAFSNNRRATHLRQRLLAWHLHAASWLDQGDIPVHLVRYEDMLSDTPAVLRRSAAFAGFHPTEEAIDRAVRFSRFAELRRQEQEQGFCESPVGVQYQSFFRRGEAGAWRDELTIQQVARIEAAQGPMMHRLGYELTVARESADA